MTKVAHPAAKLAPDTVPSIDTESGRIWPVAAPFAEST
jgi:hypothetical protein